MTEPELTPENAGELLFGKPKPDGDGGGEPSEPPGGSEPEPVELTEDEAELARRYGLSAEDVKRVRGETWAERCQDAERLANLAEPQSIRDRAKRKLREMQDSDNPNAHIIAALGAKTEQDRRLVDLVHPPTEGKDGKDS